MSPIRTLLCSSAAPESHSLAFTLYLLCYPLRTRSESLTRQLTLGVGAGAFPYPACRRIKAPGLTAEKTDDEMMCAERIALRMRSSEPPPAPFAQHIPATLAERPCSTSAGSSPAARKRPGAANVSAKVEQTRNIQEPCKGPPLASSLCCLPYLNNANKYGQGTIFTCLGTIL